MVDPSTAHNFNKELRSPETRLEDCSVCGHEGMLLSLSRQWTTVVCFTEGEVSNEHN